MKCVLTKNFPLAKSARYLAGMLACVIGGGLSASAYAQTPLPLKICVIDDRSGAAADTGIESLNGINMVIEPLNAKGGLNGRKIEIIAYDGKTDPQLTATFATRCAEDDKGLMIIGGSPSAPAAAMVPVAAQNGIPYYMMAASANNLTNDAVWQLPLLTPSLNSASKRSPSSTTPPPSAVTAHAPRSSHWKPKESRC